MVTWRETTRPGDRVPSDHYEMRNPPTRPPGRAPGPTRRAADASTPIAAGPAVGFDPMRRALILVLAPALLLAACGGGSDDEVATLEDDSGVAAEVGEAVAEVDDEERLLAFSACMRDRGIEDFPDPRLDADGSVDFGLAGDAPFEGVDDETVDAALDACIGELEGAAFAPGGADFDPTDLQDRLVEFAACMRERGFDVDDPDLGEVFGDGGFTNPFEELDADDPDVLAAVEDCQEVFAGFGPLADG